MNLCRNKRGQLNVFVILLLLISAALFFFFPNKQQTGVMDAAPVIQNYLGKSVTLFVQQCLEETLAEAVYATSMRGGYFTVPEPFVDSLVRVPLYFYDGAKKVPSKEMIAREMEHYLAARLPLCFNNFTAFKEQGIDVAEGPFEARIALGETVRSKLHIPLIIHEGGAIKTRDFSAVLPVNFDFMYSLINETIAAQEAHPDFVPLGTVMALADDKNVSTEINYLAEDIVAYSYAFSFSGMEENVTFLFGVKYHWPDSGIGSEEIDYALPFERRRCYVGDTCAFNLNIYDEPFLFGDATPLFDISSNGRVSFVPALRSVGNHTIHLTIKGGAVEKAVRFTLEIREVQRG